jgi:hypothetical protein
MLDNDCGNLEKHSSGCVGDVGHVGLVQLRCISVGKVQPVGGWVKRAFRGK